MTTTEYVPAPAQPGADRRGWAGLAVVLLAVFVDMVDVNIVSVAVPHIQRDLGTSYAAIQWVAGGYLLAFALVLITGGRLGDIVGRKKVFLVGVVGFTVASALCGAATTTGMLIGARVAQGAMAALMVPQVLATIQVMFEPRRRGIALGLYGAVLSVANVSGAVLGGLLTTYSVFGLGWRAVFWVNVPVGLLIVLGALRYVQESRSERPLRLDLLGTALVSTAAVLVVYPLVQGRDLGWPVWTFVAMAAAVPVLVGFAYAERRRDRRDESPLVPPGLFRTRSFVAGLVLLVVLFSGGASMFLLLSWYLQLALGWTALTVGLSTTGWPLGIALTTQVSLRYGAGYGRRLIALGGLIMAAGVVALRWVIEHFGAGVGPWHIGLALLIAGLGMGLVVPIVVDVVLGEVAPRDAGAGSGVANAVIQLGGALGVAAIGVVFLALLGPGAHLRETIGTPADGSAWVAATAGALWFNAGVFLLCGLLAPLLPGRKSRSEAP